MGFGLKTIKNSHNAMKDYAAAIDMRVSHGIAALNAMQNDAPAVTAPKAKSQFTPG